jgi:predicted TIM-barrel fold metal-dependent hydrolase
MRVIALEEHFVAPALAAGIAAGANIPDELKRKLGDLGDGRLADMDAGGIDLQVIGHTTPGAQAHAGEEAIALAREANDLLAAAVARHPERFGGFATLPTSEPQAAAEELQRAKSELSFVGAMINGPTGGLFLDDSRFEPLLAAAERLEMPIYVHPALPPPSVTDAYFRGFSPGVEWMLRGGAWGWHCEAGLHVLRLILAGVFDRHPRLQIVIGHMGEMLPFMLGRLDATPLPTGLERPISEYFQSNIHVTTSAIFSFPPLLCTLLTIGPERILFSVDYPFSSIEDGMAFLGAAPLSKRDRELISHVNAERLLGL